MLTVRDIHTYYGNSHVIQGISFAMESGQVTGILGRNGMGKTTLIRSIIGFTPPREGQVLFKQHDITAWPANRVVDIGLGLVPQGRRVFPSLTVNENLAVAAKGNGGPWTVERVMDLFPRLRERLSQRAGTLSGGEQQMLALSRAFLGNPRVLLMDEISMGLAPRIVEQLFESVNELRQRGLTIVLVEQYLTYALRFADICYVLAKGRIEFVGEPGELRDSEALASSYLGAG